MRLVLAGALISLLTVAIASPVRNYRVSKRNGSPTQPGNQKDPFDQIAVAINKIKTAETYDELKGRFANYEQVLKKITSSGADIVHDDLVNHHQRQYVRVIEQFFDSLKAIVPASAHPSKNDVKELAKKFSAALRETKFNSYVFIPDGTSFPMTNNSITDLAEVFSSTPVFANGNNFLEKLKAKNSKLYRAGKMLHLSLEQPEQFAEHFADEATKKLRMTEDGREFMHFVAQVFVDYYADLLKDEDAAVELFTDVALLAKVLKDPSSYESFDVLNAAISESKKLQSIGIIVKHFAKYLIKELPNNEKKEFYGIMNDLLKVLEVLLSSGTSIDGSSIREAAFNWLQKNQLRFFRVIRKIAYKHNKREGKIVLSEFFTDEEKRMIEELIFASEGKILMSDEKLNELKAKNDKVYAIAYMINEDNKHAQRHQGFGPEADGFHKKYNTAPVELEQLAMDLAPSEKLKTKIDKDFKNRLEEFNNLSVQAKKELATGYPYFTLMYLVRLS